MTNKHKVELVGNDGTGNTARLMVDGKDISSTVTALRLDVGAAHEHRLTIELAAFPLDVHLAGVEVRVPDALADVLKRLGWTPPPDKDKEDKR